ncbi:small ribosomal subunit protein uS12-like [Vicugna pacos]|uniref:Small ribosomal subunit protein uS12-like n=1 Tax=Vicugna pacos TaxID=30538 RepID=A0A6J3B3Z4_VICPA
MGLASRWTLQEVNGGCQGLRTAKKLCCHHQDQRWHDNEYKRAHLGTALKASPSGATLQAKGILLEKVKVEARQLKSAVRKVFRDHLIKKSKKLTAFIPNDGCSHFIAENGDVLVAGFGYKCHAGGDIPETHFKVVKVASVSLLALCKGKKKRRRS